MKVYASPFAKAGGPLAPVLSQRYLSRNPSTVTFGCLFLVS
jgi:hypothetical protein